MPAFVWEETGVPWRNRPAWLCEHTQMPMPHTPANAGLSLLDPDFLGSKFNNSLGSYDLSMCIDNGEHYAQMIQTQYINRTTHLSISAKC